jgi:uncharacterized protein GlcG (DUF336 family)
MDLLAFAKTIADRVESQSARAKVPVAVCIIDTHGNIILKHRMSGAPVFAIELSERKATAWMDIAGDVAAQSVSAHG